MSTIKICVVGLGYVGAPLAVELTKHFNTLGYDINHTRVDELNSGYDSNNELTDFIIKATTRVEDIRDQDVYIITVPTPVSASSVPDLEPLTRATELVAKFMSKNTIIIYESTVYPGVTEDVCVPILSKVSGLRYKTDFFVAYSPERINPGDKVHTLTTTTKIVSADNIDVLEVVNLIYSKITNTYQAKSIKIAEAAKIVENIQRDVNIALMNELSQIFSTMDIDTNDVIDTAKSKWNFLDFRPGLVGGHCISVDPYYLSHKAAQHGIIADIILSARKVNESMSKHIVTSLIQLLLKNNLPATVTILGITFKENVSDLRNSKVFDIIAELAEYGIIPQLVDPYCDMKLVKQLTGIEPVNWFPVKTSATILAVAHDGFKSWPDSPIVMDLKGVLHREDKPQNTILWRP
jgi:UDP-N-acetyl-D-galactosamine dehydrogenase